MKIRKMVNLLKDAIDNNENLYTENELNYMKEQLSVIEDEVLRLKRKDFKGFGKK